jgi:hypothetical protein
MWLFGGSCSLSDRIMWATCGSDGFIFPYVYYGISQWNQTPKALRDACYAVVLALGSHKSPATIVKYPVCNSVCLKFFQSCTDLQGSQGQLCSHFCRYLCKASVSFPSGEAILGATLKLCSVKLCSVCTGFRNCRCRCHQQCGNP